MKSAVYIGNLKNPSNKGTCIRSGEAFGVNLVFTNDDIKHYKYSQGTSKHVIFLKFNTEEDVVDYCKLNHHKIVCIENTPDAVEIKDAKYPVNPLFITGNENDGVSKTFLDNARLIVKIPQADTYCRCLNAAVACSIVMQDWSSKNRIKLQDAKDNNGVYGKMQSEPQTNTQQLKSGEQTVNATEQRLRSAEQHNASASTKAVETRKGCGKRYHDEFWGWRICGMFEDLKHSDHFIYCPDCTRSHEKESLQ